MTNDELYSIACRIYLFGCAIRETAGFSNDLADITINMYRQLETEAGRGVDLSGLAPLESVLTASALLVRISFVLGLLLMEMDESTRLKFGVFRASNPC